MTWLSLASAALGQADAPNGEDADSAFPIPAHRTVHEVLRNGSKVGEVHSTLSQDERGIWFFETDTVATSTLARMLRLSAEESAHFLWREDHVLPLTYRNISRAPLRTRFWQHELHWDEHVSESVTHQGELRIPLEDGLLDPLTLRLQVSAWLHEPERRGQNFEFRVLERDQIETQRVDDLGAETIEVNGQCYETRKLRRFRREGSSRNYLMWLAPAQHWLPVRIELGDEDDDIVLRLIESSLPVAGQNCD